MRAALWSCAAMYLSMALGLVYGVVAEYYAPVSADSFAIVGCASVLALVVAASGCRSGGTGRVGPWADAALAGFAALLMASDAYRHVTRGSFVLQSLSMLPFLLAIGHSVRCRAWLAACGAAGFVAVAEALLLCNRYGGWAGFFSVYSE